MKPGFTLFEILITVVIMTIGIGLATAWTIRTLERSELLSSTESVVSILRQQQVAARINRNNSRHGLALSSDSYTMFEGDALGSAAPESIQTFGMSPGLTLQNISLGGSGSEVVFERHDGSTANSGTFELVHPSSGESYTILVSELGLIDWQ